MCAPSNIRIPTEGELHIFSPGAVQRDGVCGRDCMHVGAFDVPHSHKLTTPMMAGPWPVRCTHVSSQHLPTKALFLVDRDMKLMNASPEEAW